MALKTYLRSCKMLIIATTVSALSVFGISYYVSATVDKDMKSLSKSETVEVVMTFSQAVQSKSLQDKFEICITSMMNHATRPIDLNIIGDRDSQKIAQKIVDLLPEKPKVIFHDMEPLARGVGDMLGDLVKYFRYAPNAYYGNNLFFISIVLHRFFTDKKQIIMLDSDLKFQTDIFLLWKEFDNFEKSNIIGIARDQQPVYRHVFNAFRRKNPKTKVGDPPTHGVTGFNSGVLLVNLEKMRTSQLYESVLRLESIELLVNKYSFNGHLGDQDLYSLLSIEHSQLFYVLSCGWNRQLCKWWKNHGYEDVFDLYWNCNDTVKIYHGNCNTEIP